MFLIDHYSGRSCHSWEPRKSRFAKICPMPISRFRFENMLLRIAKFACCLWERRGNLRYFEFANFEVRMKVKSVWSSSSQLPFLWELLCEGPIFTGNPQKTRILPSSDFISQIKKVSASEFHDAVMKVWYWTIMWRLSEKGWKKLINLIGFDILTLAHR